MGGIAALAFAARNPELARAIGGGAKGYTDYPFLDSVATRTSPIGRELT